MADSLSDCGSDKLRLTAPETNNLASEAWACANAAGQSRLAGRLDGLVPMAVLADGSIGPMGSVADSGAQRPLDRVEEPRAWSSVRQDSLRLAGSGESNLALPARYRFSADNTAAAGYYQGNNPANFYSFANRSQISA